MSFGLNLKLIVMKSHILMTLLFISASVNAQYLYSTTEKNNLKGKVRTVSDTEFKWDADENAYLRKSVSQEVYRSDGRLDNSSSELIDLQSTSGSQYSYDSKGRLVSKSYKYKDKEPTLTTYTYDGNSATTQTNYGKSVYELDNKGRTKSYRYYNKDGELTSASDYTIQADGEYKAVGKGYSKGEQISSSEHNYKNYISISSTSDYNGKASTSTATLDKHGNVAESVYKGETTVTHYKYDKKGNWIAKARKSPNSINDDINYYLYFREIEYADGTTTGSMEFDSDFAKQYFTTPSYATKDAPLPDYMKVLQDPTELTTVQFQRIGKSNFKVKTAEGNYLTKKVKNLLSPNKKDLIIYHPNSQTYMIATNFYDEFTPKQTWIDAKIVGKGKVYYYRDIPNNSWAMIVEGERFSDYGSFQTGYDTTNTNDVVLRDQQGNIKYRLPNYKNAQTATLYQVKVY